MAKGIFSAFIIFMVLMLIAVGTTDPDPATGFAIVFGILVLSIIGGLMVGKMGYKGAVKEVAVQTKTFADKSAEFSKEISKEAAHRINKQEKDLTEMKAYELAGEEIESNNMKMGLWHKAFADADGDENKQKVIYLKARVEELMQ